jgi:hypothetical protein
VCSVGVILSGYGCTVCGIGLAGPSSSILVGIAYWRNDLEGGLVCENINWIDLAHD